MTVINQGGKGWKRDREKYKCRGKRKEKKWNRKNDGNHDFWNQEEERRRKELTKKTEESKKKKKSSEHS